MSPVPDTARAAYQNYINSLSQDESLNIRKKQYQKNLERGVVRGFTALNICNPTCGFHLSRVIFWNVSSSMNEEILLWDFLAYLENNSVLRIKSSWFTDVCDPKSISSAFDEFNTSPCLDPYLLWHKRTQASPRHNVLACVVNKKTLCLHWPQTHLELQTTLLCLPSAVSCLMSSKHAECPVDGRAFPAEHSQ